MHLVSNLLSTLELETGLDACGPPLLAAASPTHHQQHLDKDSEQGRPCQGCFCQRANGTESNGMMGYLSRSKVHSSVYVCLLEEGPKLRAQ